VLECNVNVNGLIVLECDDYKVTIQFMEF